MLFEIRSNQIHILHRPLIRVHHHNILNIPLVTLEHLIVPPIDEVIKLRVFPCCLREHIMLMVDLVGLIFTLCLGVNTDLLEKEVSLGYFLHLRELKSVTSVEVMV